MKKIFNRFSFTALCFACAFLTAACTPPDKGQAPVKKTNVSKVEYVFPTKKKVEIWDEYTAKIEGEKSVEIRARVNGYLRKVHFNDGDYVRDGDLLFEIDPRPFVAAVSECEASMSEIRARISLAKSNLERAEELYKGNAISKEVLESRKSELASLEAVLKSAQAQLDNANLNLEYTSITAPISGYVSKRLVDEGNLINDSTTLMATVVSRDIVYAYFEISERDLISYVARKLFDSINPAQRTGPPVKLRLLDEAKADYFGYLSYVDNSLNASSIQLRASIDNSKGTLYPGMFGKIQLRSGEPQEEIMVPELSVGTDLVGRYVLVVRDDDTIEYRAVIVGEVLDKMQIVREGLNGDEKIVVSGLQRSIPGRKVVSVLKKEDDVAELKSQE